MTCNWSSGPRRGAGRGGEAGIVGEAGVGAGSGVVENSGSDGRCLSGRAAEGNPVSIVSVLVCNRGMK